MAEKQTIIRIKVEGTSEMEKLKQEIIQTQEAIQKSKKAYKEGAITQKQFTKETTASGIKLKALTGEFNKQSKDIIGLNQKLKLAEGSYASLANKNKKLSIQLRNLGDPLGKNKKKFDQLSKSIKKNTTDMQKMDAQMGRYHKNVGNYSSALKGFTTKLAGIGLAATGVIMAFQQLKRVTDIFVDFEFQMKQVQIMSQATDAEFAQLSEQAKELGASTTNTAGEIAGLQKELAKLGFDPTQILAMTESIQGLAFSFDADLAQTTETVGATLRMFNLDADETTRVTDVMAKAFASSSLTLERFQTAMPKVGAVANAMNFSLEDTTAMLGLLSKAGFEASTTGTSLRNIMLKMADPAGDLAKALGGPIDSIDDLGPAFEMLESKGIDVAEALEMTDVRSAAAFITLVKGNEDLTQLAETLENASGTTKEFSEHMKDSLKGSFAETSSAAQGFALDLVERLEPAITLFLDGLTGLFGMLKKIAPIILSVTAGWIGYRVAIMAAKLQQSLFNITVGSASVSLYTFRGAGIAAAMGVRSLTAAIMANPFGLLIAGLTTGISLLFSYGGSTDDVTDSLDDQSAAEADLTKELTIKEKALKNIDKIKKDAKSDEMSEIAELKQLKQVIFDENAIREERASALESFNKIAGTNISALQDEKQIVDEVTRAYEIQVDAIKATIIAKSSTEQIQQLLIVAMDVEEQLELQRIKTGETKLVLDKKVAVQTETQNTLDDESNKRVAKGLQSTDQLIKSTESLNVLKTKVNNTESEFQHSMKITSNLNTQAVGDQTTLQGTNIVTLDLKNDLIRKLEIEENIRKEELIKKKKLLKLTQEGNDAQVTGVEIMALESDATTENGRAIIFKNAAVIESNLEAQNTIANQDDNIANSETMLDLNRENELSTNQVTFATQDYNAEIRTQTVLETELSDLELQMNEIIEKKNKLLDGLNVTSGTFTESLKDQKDAYGKLKDKISEQEQAVRLLLLEEYKKAGADADHQEIIQKGLDLINKESKDTKNLAQNKELLKKVTEAYIEIMKEQVEFDLIGKLGDEIVKIEEKKEAIESEIKAIELVEQADIDMTEQRIKNQIKLQKLIIKGIMKQIELTGTMDAETAKKLQEAKDEIRGFEAFLDSMSGPEYDMGFLNKKIFGKGKDGGGISLGQFVEMLSATLQMTSSLLGEITAVQEAELNKRVTGLEREKEIEVAKFEESALAETMTEEEKADKIIQIEEGFDEKILALQKEQFDKSQKLQRAMTIMNTASAVMEIWGSKGTGFTIADWIMKGIQTAMVIATGALQLKQINAQVAPAEFGGIEGETFASGGMVQGPSHDEGGVKFAVGGRVVELEGGEAVISKKATAMFRPQLSAMNVAGGGRKFAEGGITLDSEMLQDVMMKDLTEVIQQSLTRSPEIILTEANVSNSQKSVETIETKATF